MYKNCAQLVENQREKPVPNYPQFPPNSPTPAFRVKVSRTLPQIMPTTPPANSHVLHSPVGKNNRGESHVFHALHTAYYYYY